ncbi:hypothetical protein BHE74_00031131 [Ensete ventricosum]|nr:hypothetical protein GW17_00017679 [Ensete ventricosum]RWW61784.1 hypothetical protein BHE74_00031131 [Ensete ventricosum]RZR87188.1 hypothetical protein BHM03_00014548 [Ensete ventricosum]
MDPRSSLGIGPSSDDAMGPRREFARRFAEGIRKLTRNTFGDRRRKNVKLVAVESGGCWITGVNHPYPGFRVAEPPRSMGESLVPRFSRSV